MTASAMLPDRAIPGETREVDICIRSELAGHEVLIGIECRMSGSRKQTVEWVEAMHAKHSHLPTSKVVLVSSSGFTKNALKLADFFGMKAITPTDVEPGFVGEIVNNIHTVWAKRFDLTAKKVVIDFDPPLRDIGSIEIAGPFESLAVVSSDGSSVCAAKDLAQLCLQKIDVSGEIFRDAVTGEGELTSDHTPTANDGSPMCLVLDDTDPPQTQRQITRVHITSLMRTYVEEVPLKHGQYDGTPYSVGTAEMGDQTFHWVVTEGKDGTQMGARVSPVGDPTRGQFFAGKTKGRTAT
ncbi:hypothetical protein NIIDNTM18_29720 [Mycolicibacterium litorale]|uniref:Restriction endonuclease type IV Mrr domain-containing protein n=1 Tax=Mycolicibacterium litorale TaxID=758802 RepID=A0A6S6P4U5_9MYCO|nr:hypothetical protein NIIDNTM18_29720 [Mycolicibacterium litorale]